MLDVQAKRRRSERRDKVNQKVNFPHVAPMMFILLLALLGVTLLILNNLPAPVFEGNWETSAGLEAFDYERAADISAQRWQAMAHYYEAQGLLTRDAFDYEQAAENSAYRWQAMARYYDEHGLLTRDAFDYEQAAENSAYRWQAMARAYERMGLLNER